MHQRIWLGEWSCLFEIRDWVFCAFSKTYEKMKKCDFRAILTKRRPTSVIKACQFQELIFPFLE